MSIVNEALAPGSAPNWGFFVPYSNVSAYMPSAKPVMQVRLLLRTVLIQGAGLLVTTVFYAVWPWS